MASVSARVTDKAHQQGFPFGYPLSENAPSTDAKRRKSANRSNPNQNHNIFQFE
jgi:hypothetical protein